MRFERPIDDFLSVRRHVEGIKWLFLWSLAATIRFSNEFDLHQSTDPPISVTLIHQLLKEDSPRCCDILISIEYHSPPGVALSLIMRSLHSVWVGRGLCRQNSE